MLRAGLLILYPAATEDWRDFQMVDDLCLRNGHPFALLGLALLNFPDAA